jgi:polar amino acid transport system substrate-binding protein
MGKFVLWFFLIFLFLLKIAGAQELTIISEEGPPFNFSEDGVLTGSSTEVVREILRRLNMPDNIKVLTWARGYNLALTKPNIVLFSTTRTKERENLFHWVGPIFKVRFGFYAKKGSGLHLKTLEDAKKVSSIATYKDDVREQLLRAQGFTNLDSSKSPVSNLKKLISGRVGLWLFDNLGVPLIARQIGIDPEEVELVLPFQDHYSYIAISKTTPEAVVNEWQQTLDDMKLDGTFDRISGKWLPKDSIPGSQTGVPAIQEGRGELEIYTEDSPPGNYLVSGKPVGFAVEVVREILRRNQQPDNIQVVPWARGYTLAFTRPNVALFSTTRLPQREELFKWVGPLYSQTWGFYGKKGSGLQIKSLDDAKKVPLIGTYSLDAKEQFLQSKGFHNLVSTNKNIANIRHLMQGNIDLWVSSDFNMPYQVQQAGVNPDQLELVYPFRKVKNYIALSIQTPDDLIRKWQQTLDEIKKDGTYARIRSN